MEIARHLPSLGEPSSEQCPTAILGLARQHHDIAGGLRVGLGTTMSPKRNQDFIIGGTCVVLRIRHILRVVTELSPLIGPVSGSDRGGGVEQVPSFDPDGRMVQMVAVPSDACFGEETIDGPIERKKEVRTDAPPGGLGVGVLADPFLPFVASRPALGEMDHDGLDIIDVVLAPPCRPSSLPCWGLDVGGAGRVVEQGLQPVPQCIDRFGYLRAHDENRVRWSISIWLDFGVSTPSMRASKTR